MRRLQLAVLSAALLGPSSSVRAQAQDRLGYDSKQLDCTQFLETAESHILTQSGGREREQRSGRRGVWRFRAQPAQDGVALEGWLDSLTLWRRSAETTIRPDTDGLIGGRYRGILTRSGIYSSRTQPFVPDEVAEVAGMATALDDLFARLPSRALPIGEQWRDSQGLIIQRMPDSALSGMPLYRFALEESREDRTARTQRDTIAVRLHQVTRERGMFLWHPVLGMIARERTIVVETSVPASRSLGPAVRSRIEQRIRLRRDLTLSPTGCSGPVKPAGARLRTNGTHTGLDSSTAPVPAAPGR